MLKTRCLRHGVIYPSIWQETIAKVCLTYVKRISSSLFNIESWKIIVQTILEESLIIQSKQTRGKLLTKRNATFIKDKLDKQKNLDKLSVLFRTGIIHKRLVNLTVITALLQSQS